MRVVMRAHGAMWAVGKGRGSRASFEAGQSMLESNCSGGSWAVVEVGAWADALPPPWFGCWSCWCRFIGSYLFARSNCRHVCARFLAFIQLQAGCQFVLQKDTRGSATERCTNWQLEMRWRISATPMAARHSYLALHYSCSFAFIICPRSLIRRLLACLLTDFFAPGASRPCQMQTESC